MKFILSKIFKFLAYLILKIFGWRVTSSYPKNIKKLIVIGAPHTSNWDAFFGILWAYYSEAPIKYIIKKEAMIFPLNLILRILGAIPIYRNHDKTLNTVQRIVNIINSKRNIFLAISPEGTRKKVIKWKTGFYFIAKLAKVPILPLYIDYKKKEIGSFKLYYPSDDVHYDINFLKNLYHNVQGKNLN